MLSKQEIEKIKAETKTFFEKMGFEVEFEFSSQKGDTLQIKITMEAPQPLIGRGGMTLVKLQRLLGVVLKRKIKTEEEFFIDLDINNYKEKKTEYLKELAQRTADEVSLTREERVLSPMPAFERRIIHLELADRRDIATESMGLEPQRSVVIRPYP